MNKKEEKEIDKISFIGAIVIFIIMIGGATYWVIITEESSKKEFDCLREIAKDFCEERGQISIQVNQPRFFCVDSRRDSTSDGNDYKFLPEEKQKCKDFSQSSEKEKLK